MHTTNIDKLLKLTAALRELFDSDGYRTAATYATQLGDLMDAHDKVKIFERGTMQNSAAYTTATTRYNNARIYASKNGMPHPNDVLAAAGYTNLK